MSNVKNNQSIFDLSTQDNGDVKSAIDLAVLNDFSLTDDLTAGLKYEKPETLYVNENIKAFFFSKEIELTTSEPKVILDPIGIGTMIIGTNFDVT